MYIAILCVLSFALAAQKQQGSPQDDDAIMLKKTPSINGDSYHCAEMVQVVNYLRQLGKDKSLGILRDYLTTSKEDDKVLVICRLLFDDPKGWEPPRLGAPVPTINKKGIIQFPLFPLALSDRVPFLLIMGYRLGGRGESAAACLKRCQGLSLVKEDYPLTGYEEAARALIKTDSFRQLYEERDREEMAEIILRQAKAAGPAEEKKKAK